MNPVISTAALDYATKMVEWHAARARATRGDGPHPDANAQRVERLAYGTMCEAQEWLNVLAREEALRAFS